MKKAFFNTIIFAFILSCMLRTPADADWINLSGAEVDLEIFVNDMVAFDRMVPDAFFKGAGIKRPPLAERMRRFSDENLQIITDKGEKLRATLKLIEPRFRKDRPENSIPTPSRSFRDRPRTNACSMRSLSIPSQKNLNL